MSLYANISPILVQRQSSGRKTTLFLRPSPIPSQLSLQCFGLFGVKGGKTVVGARGTGGRGPLRGLQLCRRTFVEIVQLTLIHGSLQSKFFLSE